jgi:hypothetical protein
LPEDASEREGCGRRESCEEDKSEGLGAGSCLLAKKELAELGREEAC